MSSKRIALIVGCGSIGQRHARLLDERGDIEIWGCDPVQSNLDELQGIAQVRRVFTDYTLGLRAKPDLVWVCTPNRSHAPIAIDAMRAGADILCEKPLADTVQAGQAMVRAVEETGRTLMVGYTLRWTPGFQFIHQALQANQLGAVIGARACLHGRRSLEWARTDYRLHERAALLLDYSHEIDYLRWFFGEVADAKAFSATLDGRSIQVHPNIVQAILRFRSGPLASLHFDYVQISNGRELEIFADHGMVRYNTAEEYLSVYADQEDACQRVGVKINDYDDPYRNEIQAFLDAVDNHTQPPVTVYDGLEVLKIIDAIVASYERESV